jgi:thioredoxin reductase (NADPH)
MSDRPSEYEVVVVGGGPAGLSTALYTTRLGHETAVVDRGGGRAAMMLDTHNVVGVPESVSGNEFLETAREQVRAYGADYVRDLVESGEETGDGRYRLSGTEGTYLADRVVLATGFDDVHPDPPLPRTGTGLHYCLHCDAYMFVDEPVYVMGTGDSAAYVAMIMLNFTDDVDLLLRGEAPTWSEETGHLLENHPVDVVEAEITGMNRGADGWLESFEFDDGTARPYRGGFPMYGSEYNADLAEQFGCDRTDDGAVAVDDHGRTSVEGVFAVGDLTPGHNQIPVAMGEGADAGIRIHTDLRAFPRSAAEIERTGPVSPSAVPAMAEDLRATARAFRERESDAEATAGED